LIGIQILFDFINFISLYSPALIFINFAVTLIYTLLTVCAQKGILSSFPANIYWLLSVIVSSLLLTLLFAKHGVDTLNQKNSILNIPWKYFNTLMAVLDSDKALTDRRIRRYFYRFINNDVKSFC